MLWHHSKVVLFRWTPERQGQHSIDFWTLEMLFPKCPTPFWQAQPHPRTFLFLSLFTSILSHFLARFYYGLFIQNFGLQ